MGPLRKFEKRLERLFEEPFAKAFRGGVHPLEIARRLTREIDDARVLGVSGTLAPNNFVVRLGQRDHERLSGVAGSLAAEMEALVITYTNQRDYRLITRPRVEFQLDDSLREGEFSLLATLDEPPASGPTAGRVEAGRPAAPADVRPAVLTITRGEKRGARHELDAARTRIGRADDNDVVLADLRASRFHAEIERTPSGYVLRDLESTNGTMVGGRKVRERLLEDGDTLVIGETEMRFGLSGDPRPR